MSAPRTAERATDTRCRILIVDDDLMIRESLRDLLETQGFEVVAEATNGSNALTLAGSLHPDVVLMDMRMPQMDGIECTRRLREVSGDLAVIILSAYDDASLRRDADEAGAHSYVVKGWPPSILESAIHEAWSPRT